MNPVRTILFVIPPYFNAEDYVGDSTTSVLPSFTIPYGILSMEAYLRDKLGSAVRIHLVDLNITLRDMLNNENTKDYLERFNTVINSKIAETSPDIVGVSALFNSSYQYIQNLAHNIKTIDENIIIVAGGGLPSAAYDRLLHDCADLDAICKGEGEIPVRSLLESNDMRLELEVHKSWITRSGLNKLKTPEHTFLEDLDEIPMLNYGIVNLDDYNNRGIDKRYSTEDRISAKREMAIHTSRGCPFLCVFCSNPSLHGRSVRYMSVGKVLEEVKRMRNEFGLTALMIEDDHFFNDIERAKQILRGLSKLEIRIEFPNGLAVYAIDDDVAKLLREAGVSAVALAVESGSDYVLNKIIKKPLKTKLIKPAVDALRRHGVRAHVFIVAGLPGETDEHREETVQMLLDNGFDWAHIYLAIPIFGSRLYDLCVENGYIENQNTTDHIATKAVIRAPTVDPEKLEKYAYETQLRVNFVDSFNIKHKNYEIALPYLENVVNKYPGHAFGHLYLAKCYDGLGKSDLACKHLARARYIIENDSWWTAIAGKFNITFEECLQSSSVA